MTISTESYTAAAGQARQATEKSVEVFKNVSQSFTNQLDAFRLPSVDLTQPVARYFEYVQKAVDLNRDLATQWAELVTNFSGSVREQAEQVGSIVQEQTDTVAELATRQAEKAEQAAKAQAEEAAEQARPGGQARRAGRGPQGRAAGRGGRSRRRRRPAKPSASSGKKPARPSSRPARRTRD